MQVALFSSLALNDVSQTPAEVMDGTRTAVRMADEMGLDAAWFVEHHFSAFSVCGSPLMMAMHCAAITRKTSASGRRYWYCRCTSRCG